MALGCLLAGYGWKGLQYLVKHEANDGLRGLGKFLAQAPAVGDIVVAPFTMDLEVWYYAKQAIQRGLVSAVAHGRLSSPGGTAPRRLDRRAQRRQSAGAG